MMMIHIATKYTSENKEIKINSQSIKKNCKYCGNENSNCKISPGGSFRQQQPRLQPKQKIFNVFSLYMLL